MHTTSRFLKSSANVKSENLCWILTWALYMFEWYMYIIHVRILH